MTLDRRNMLAMTLAATAVPVRAKSWSTQTIPLWAGVPPGGEGLQVRDEAVLRTPGDPDDIAWSHVAMPTLTVTVPARPNGAAVLLIPGGGYRRVALRRGGSAEAQMLAARGYLAADLLYRLPHDGWAAGPDAPLEDARRAIRVLRASASRWGVDPARIGALGFSAGGHLCARLGSRAEDVERPAVLGLFFPVVLLSGPQASGGSRVQLLGPGASDARADTFAANVGIPVTMPPTYVACAADDPVVSPANSIAMFDALRGAGIAAELTIYERGGHGLPPTAPGAAWPEGWLVFAKRHGL